MVRLYECTVVTPAEFAGCSFDLVLQAEAGCAGVIGSWRTSPGLLKEYQGRYRYDSVHQTIYFYPFGGRRDDFRTGGLSLVMDFKDVAGRDPGREGAEIGRGTVYRGERLPECDFVAIARPWAGEPGLSRLRSDLALASPHTGQNGEQEQQEEYADLHAR